MKKIIVLTLTFLYISALNVFAESVYEEFVPQKDTVVHSKASRSVSSIDPNINDSKKTSNFPGFRGANQLVIYTPCYGKRTGTNEFGAEAIVKENTVVALSGADSLIPVNGLVISGHGSAKTWINKNLIVGSKVYINRENNTITVYTTSESYIYGAKECLKEVREVMDYYIANDKTYNSKKIEDSG